MFLLICFFLMTFYFPPGKSTFFSDKIGMDKGLTPTPSHYGKFHEKMEFWNPFSQLLSLVDQNKYELNLKIRLLGSVIIDPLEDSIRYKVYTYLPPTVLAYSSNYYIS